MGVSETMSSVQDTSPGNRLSVCGPTDACTIIKSQDSIFARGKMIEIKVDDKGVVALLKQVQERVSDTPPIMRDIGELIKTSVKRNRSGQEPHKSSHMHHLYFLSFPRLKRYFP